MAARTAVENELVALDTRPLGEEQVAQALLVGGGVVDRVARVDPELVPLRTSPDRVAAAADASVRCPRRSSKFEAL